MTQEFNEAKKWEALLRGTVLTSTTQKLFNFISLADQKAQAMIILNSILVPILFNWMDKPDYETGILIALGTALISIFFSILCIYPKRRRGSKPDGTRNYLHFGDIGRIKEEQYLQEFMPIFNNFEKLSAESVKDLHDMSRRIIIPKFFWLKMAYGVFFVGNLIAILCVLFLKV